MSDTGLAQERKAKQAQWVDQLNDGNATWGKPSVSFEQKQALVDAQNQARIQRDLIREAFQWDDGKSINYIASPKKPSLGALQSIYDLPIPGLTKPEPPAKVKPVEPVIASQHEGRKFR